MPEGDWPKCPVCGKECRLIEVADWDYCSRDCSLKKVAYMQALNDAATYIRESGYDEYVADTIVSQGARKMTLDRCKQCNCLQLEDKPTRHRYPCVPMEWYEVHMEASAGHNCWECGESVVECDQGCAPFCPTCVGESETFDCHWCNEPLLDPDAYPVKGIPNDES